MDVNKLARMANQIAANFAATGHENAVAETKMHIWKFWDPRMKAGIFEDMSALSPIASEAIALLKAEAEAA